MIKTFISWIFLALILFLGIWYFLLKNSDYSISFKSSAGTGEIYQSLLYYPFDKKFDNTQIIERVPFEKLVQEIILNKEKIKLTWNISEDTEDKSLIRVDVNSSNSFQNRLNLLFKRNKLQDRITEEIKEVKNNLEGNSELYDVKILGKAISPATTCACITLKNELDQKAFDMIKNINSLSNFVMENEVEMTAKPRIVVNSWNRKSNVIVYDFCFPIAKNSVSNPPQGISIKEFQPVESIKAIYNGNYMYSHLAWMQLLNYAKTNNLEVEDKPLEIFNDNPEMGGDARNWEAEIFLPLK